MRLTPNLYSLVRNDKIAALPEYHREAAAKAIEVLSDLGALETSRKGDPEEFIAIKLKDFNAPPALFAYADKASQTDLELAVDMAEAGVRAMMHPSRKQPD